VAAREGWNVMRAVLMAALVALMVTRLATQVPAFDAVSVKGNTTGETRTRFENPPGRFTAVNVPLRFLIRQAYRVPESRIFGGPSWIAVDRFDIAATAPPQTTSDQNRQMLRALLADRFALITHTETRELPTYVLRVVRGERLGPGLRRSDTDCTGQGSRMLNGRVQCGILVSQAPGSASLRGGGTSIADIARMLGDFLDRPLVDETGLAGVFDFELQFTADRSAVPGAVVPGGLAASSSPDEVPSIFTALQEQLGLKLEPSPGLVDVLVVDRAERPASD